MSNDDSLKPNASSALFLQELEVQLDQGTGQYHGNSFSNKYHKALQALKRSGDLLSCEAEQPATNGGRTLVWRPLFLPSRSLPPSDWIFFFIP